MSERDSMPNWPEKTDATAVCEIVRLAEAHLEDALAMALGADQRAISQANMMAAIAVAVFVASTAIAALSDHDGNIIVALVVSALGFLIAAGVAMRAAKPVNYFPRGFQPRLLVGCSDDPEQLHKWVAEDLQRRIVANRAVLTRTAQLTTRSHHIALASVLVPLAAWAFLQLPG